MMARGTDSDMSPLAPQIPDAWHRSATSSAFRRTSNLWITLNLDIVGVAWLQNEVRWLIQRMAVQTGR